MSAFWRSLFTSHHETRPTTPSPIAASAPAQQPPRKKQHSRSSSSPTNLSAGAGATRHIYASSNSTRPGHSAPPAHAAHLRSHSRPDRKRSSSCVGTSSPSPVRFAASARVSEERSYTASSRPPYMRSNSHGSGGPNNLPYAIYAPSTSYSSSSRTASATSVARMPPRTDSSSSVPRHSFEMRPPLKQHHTWHGDDAERGDKGKRSNIHSVPVEITPLMAASGRSKKSYIEYDVTFLPSARSVMNRHTRSAFPEQTLLQPVTRQPTTSRLTLRSHKFPWSITVSPSPPKGAPKTAFYIGSAPTAAQQIGPITILDVLQAIHLSLNTPVTQQEWETLGAGSKTQKKVTKAYRARCTKMGGGWESGVRRIDWLGSKTKLIGLEVESGVADGRTCKLAFARV